MGCVTTVALHRSYVSKNVRRPASVSWQALFQTMKSEALSMPLLTRVSTTSASNAWAVGEVTARTAEQTLILHWNGRKWARVASPNPGGLARDNTLNAVAATSTSSAWAVGSYQNGTSQSNIILYWNGRKWAHVNSPRPGTQNGLSGVAASSAGNVWAVGYFKISGPEQALALHCC